MSCIVTLHTVNGRDKIARFMQYLCRLLGYASSDKLSVDKYKFLEYQLSTFRKLLRFGRSMECFYLASKSIHNEDKLHRCSGLAKVALGCYLVCDHFLVMNRLKILQLDNEIWSASANRYWLLAIILNLIHNYLEFKNLYKTFYKKTDSIRLTASESIKQYYPLYIDIIKNCCDIFIPLSLLNYVKLNAGIVGVLGMVSSLASLIQLLKHCNRLI